MDIIGTQLILMRRTPKEIPITIAWPPKHMPDANLIEQYRKANAAGKVSDHSYLTFLQTSFEREQQLLEQEAKAKKLLQDRLIKMGLTDTNEEPNNDTESSEEDFQEELQDIATGKRNGIAHSFYEIN
jgi:hypothetical protein